MVVVRTEDPEGDLGSGVIVVDIEEVVVEDTSLRVSFQRNVGIVVVLIILLVMTSVQISKDSRVSRMASMVVISMVEEDEVEGVMEVIPGQGDRGMV